MLNDCKSYKTTQNAQRVIDKFVNALNADTKATAEFARVELRPVPRNTDFRWVPCLIVDEKDLWFGMNLWHASHHTLLIFVRGTCGACCKKIPYTEVTCAEHRL